MLLSKITQLPEGYSIGHYRGVKYGITRRTFNRGRSFKVFAEALGDRDFISLNLYLTGGGEHLKPCEMPPEKVIDFLNHVKPHSL